MKVVLIVETKDAGKFNIPAKIETLADVRKLGRSLDSKVGQLVKIIDGAKEAEVTRLALKVE